jgi:hypothetical protein
VKAAILTALVMVGCGSSSGRPTTPVVTTGPDEFVLRDVRKDAAPRMACQVPNVMAQVSSWAGSEGNVDAYGCGYELHYYLRCLTSHQCSISLTD